MFSNSIIPEKNKDNEGAIDWHWWNNGDSGGYAWEIFLVRMCAENTGTQHTMQSRRGNNKQCLSNSNQLS